MVGGGYLTIVGSTWWVVGVPSSLPLTGDCSR